MLSTFSIRSLKKLASSERLPNYSNDTKAVLVERLSYLQEHLSCEIAPSKEKVALLELGKPPSAPTEQNDAGTVTSTHAASWEVAYHAARAALIAAIVAITLAVAIGLASRAAVRAGRATKSWLEWFGSTPWCGIDTWFDGSLVLHLWHHYLKPDLFLKPEEVL